MQIVGIKLLNSHDSFEMNVVMRIQLKSSFDVQD